MISVLIVAHQPLATALLGCCRHIYRGLPIQAAALDIIPDEDPDQALQAARSLAARINDGSGQVVLTDLYGATPARIAVQLADPGRISVFYGVNLPMLLKVFSYRARLSLDELEALVLRDAAEGIGMVDAGLLGQKSSEDS
ncbi:MAG: PTS fructose transporter subunit IIA [Lautropia sp.]|nr:PTS fructose transporter subunit IIA [Lautropia sp.]